MPTVRFSHAFSSSQIPKVVGSLRYFSLNKNADAAFRTINQDDTILFGNRETCKMFLSSIT